VAVFEDGSTLKAHNIFDPLPEFMRSADLVFVDPPWNLGNLNSFYTKAERTDYQANFKDFYRCLFWHISQIKPRTCYVEVGKEYLADFIQEMRALYRYVTFYNSSYYHKQENMCYVIRGSHKRKKLPLDYMDEEDIIAWICEHEDYQCIGDPCMGLGLVGVHAAKNGRRFVGTELNHKRLSVLLEKLSKAGRKYELRSV
jgi:DNA modification methylase